MPEGSKYIQSGAQNLREVIDLKKTKTAKTNKYQRTTTPATSGTFRDPLQSLLDLNLNATRAFDRQSELPEPPDCQKSISSLLNSFWWIIPNTMELTSGHTYDRFHIINEALHEKMNYGTDPDTAGLPCTDTGSGNLGPAHTEELDSGIESDPDSIPVGLMKMAMK